MQGPIFGHAIENVPNGADFDLFRIGIGINPRQAAAIAERHVADFGDGVGDGDACQAGATEVFTTRCISISSSPNGRKVISWILLRENKIKI